MLTQGEKLKRPVVWVALFVVVFMVVGYFTWEGILTLATTSIVIIVTLSYHFGNTRIIRICAKISSVIWIICNISQLSVAGAITEIFCLLALLIAFWRFDIRKQSQIS